MKIIFIILALLLSEQADIPKQRGRKRSEQTTQEKIKIDKPKEKPPTPGFNISLPDLQPVYGFGNEENAKASQGTKKEPKKKEDKKEEIKKEDKKEPPPRKSMRWHTAWERLPKGLPKWFYELDIDEDGQIEMWEWAEDWTEEGWTTEDVEEFKKYDLNDDGIITPEEVLKVEKLK